MTSLVLCRHAEPGNDRQSHSLATHLSSLPLAAVYTSPLDRALRTAHTVASEHALTPVEIEDLREIDFGDVEGLGFDAFPAELQRGLLRDPAAVRFPGGETFAELQERVCSALDEIVAAHAGATVAAISHAGSIRAALARWLLMSADASFRVDQRHASLNVVDWHDGVPFVRLVNGCCASR